MILIGITFTTIFVLLTKIQNYKNPLSARVECKCFKLYDKEKNHVSEWFFMTVVTCSQMIYLLIKSQSSDIAYENKSSLNNSAAKFYT